MADEQDNQDKNTSEPQNEPGIKGPDLKVSGKGVKVGGSGGEPLKIIDVKGKGAKKTSDDKIELDSEFVIPVKTGIQSLAEEKLEETAGEALSEKMTDGNKQASNLKPKTTAAEETAPTLAETKAKNNEGGKESDEKIQDKDGKKSEQPEQKEQAEQPANTGEPTGGQTQKPEGAQPGAEQTHAEQPSAPQETDKEAPPQTQAGEEQPAPPTQKNEGQTPATLPSEHQPSEADQNTQKKPTDSQVGTDKQPPIDQTQPTAGQPNAQPQQVPTNEQPGVAGNLKNEQAQKRKGLGERLGDTGRAIKNVPGNAARGIGNAAKGVGNAIRNPRQTAKNAAKKIARGAASNMRDLTLARNKLRREAKKMEKELAGLNEKTVGKKNSWSMQVIKFFFPGIYARITAITNIPANASSATIIKILQAKVARLEAAKKALQAGESISVSWDAISMTGTIIGATYGIAIIFIIPIFICLFIFYWIHKVGLVTKALDETIKQIDEELKPLKEKLGIAKKKLQLRRGIQQKYQEISQTDRLSLARNRQNQQQQAQQEQAQQEQAQPPEQNQQQNDALPDDDPYNSRTD